MPRASREDEIYKNTVWIAEQLIPECTCWEGCNDREGQQPCPHTVLWEGLQLWKKKFPNAKSARYP
jgi:hypothetical protein